jgi:hypothetical protein
LFWHVLDCVGGPSRLALVDDLDATVQVRGHLDVVGVGDDLDVRGAGLGDGVDDPVDHRAPAEAVEDLGSTRPHPGAVTGGEDDGR